MSKARPRERQVWVTVGRWVDMLLTNTVHEAHAERHDRRTTPEGPLTKLTANTKAPGGTKRDSKTDGARHEDKHETRRKDDTRTGPHPTTKTKRTEVE